MINSNFSSWPSFTDEEANAVQRVLLSNKVNYWTGEETHLFEKEFAEWCGVNYCVAVFNGTLALDLALKAIAIKPGDEVVVTPRTFIASISCVVNAGAKPVFADIDISSGNISAATIASVITPKTRAVICVHLAGWPCDMDPIMELAELHNLKVIEDCAQAHGAKYKGRSVGSIGHIGAWSFCQDKIITTGGEGGMVTTNDKNLWRIMWEYKDHGKSYEAVYEREHAVGFRWLHESFGTNWRMIEMQAVIGRIQLNRIAEWVKRRTHNATLIGITCSKFKSLRVPVFKTCDNFCNCVPLNSKSCAHAYYKFYVYVKSEFLNLGWNREEIIKAINKLGVPCYHGTCAEVYLEKAFDGTGWRPESRLPVANELGETSLMFLVHPTLTSDEIIKTCCAIQEVMLKATHQKYVVI